MKTISCFVLAFAAFHVFSQTTLTLQPGPNDGKDAPLFSCVPCGFSTTNYETYHKFSSVAWTNQGANSDIKSVIDFDLSSIPAGATIISAELSLFFNPDDSSGPHNNLTSSNASYLRRVTTPWDESTVTWDTQPSITTVNQVIVPESTSSTQDYPDMDVTNLVQDMINDPANSHGLMLEGISDQEYHGLYFASSDHQNAELRPKLVVTYDLNSSISEIEAVEFSLFPNPSAGIIHLQTSETIESVDILDISGKLVLSEENPSTTLDVSRLNSGNYFIQVTTEMGVGTEKLIVQ